MNPNDGMAPNPPSSQSKPAPNLRRLYSVWPGNNKFLCGGRLVLGSKTKSLYLTTCMIACPSITFCITRLYKIRNRDPVFGDSVLIGGFVLTTLALVFLCMTSARDPGIIPRNHEPEDEQQSETCSEGWGSHFNSKPPPTKDVKVNGHTVKVKYCETCHLYRPPRASHCSACNNCVQKFDHHCPWLGQCIGLRNYRSFMVFISSSTLLCVYVLVLSLFSLVHDDRSWWHTIADDFVSVGLALYCFIVVWFVGGLTVFHFYLICTNQTTYENFRYRFERNKNPYNLGVSKNLEQVFLVRTPPSQVNFRELVIVVDEKS